MVGVLYVNTMHRARGTKTLTHEENYTKAIHITHRYYYHAHGNMRTFQNGTQ